MDLSERQSSSLVSMYLQFKTLGYLGHFPLNENSENFEMGKELMVWIFPGKVYQETWKLLHTHKASHSITEIGGKQNQTEIQVKKFLKISVYLVCFSRNS